MPLQENAIVVEQYMFIEVLPDLILYMPDGSKMENFNITLQESNT